MADKTTTSLSITDPIKLADLGDGSYAVGVALNGSSVPNSQPVPIKITGASYQTVFNRAIYNTSVTSSIAVPLGVRGCLFIAKVYAVTGTNPSLIPEFRLQTYSTTSAASTSVSGSAMTSGPKECLIYWYPGASLGQATAVSPNECKVVALPLADYVYCRFTISGTFNTGEGFDAGAWIYWIP